MFILFEYPLNTSVWALPGIKSARRIMSRRIRTLVASWWICYRVFQAELPWNQAPFGTNGIKCDVCLVKKLLGKDGLQIIEIAVLICACIHQNVVARFVEHPQFSPAINSLQLVKSYDAGYPPAINQGNAKSTMYWWFPPYISIYVECV